MRILLMLTWFAAFTLYGVQWGHNQEQTLLHFALVFVSMSFFAVVLVNSLIEYDAEMHRTNDKSSEPDHVATATIVRCKVFELWNGNAFVLYETGECKLYESGAIDHMFEEGFFDE